MSLFEKNDGVGTAARPAPSEWKITTPTEGPDEGVVNERADGGDIGLPLDAVALSGMSPRARLIRRGLSSSPAIHVRRAGRDLRSSSPSLRRHVPAVGQHAAASSPTPPILLTMAVGMTS